MTAVERKKFYKFVGEKIKDARKSKGYKQEVFAKSLCLSRVSIVNIEKGRQRPSAHLLYDIAKTLNVELISLYPPVQDTIGVTKDYKKIINKEFATKNDQVSKKLVSQAVSDLLNP
jgi:transcriptional regulator with XRE-family HTH domain